MSKYVLVFPIEGRAERYHRALTRDISRKFSVADVQERVVPHVTLKFLGEVTKSHLQDLDLFLSKFMKGRSTLQIELKGINHFERDVIFIDVERSAELNDFYKDIYSGLITLGWVQRFQFEGDNFHPHSTIACDDISEEFDDIYQSLARRNPHYVLPLKSLALLKQSKFRWRLYKKYSSR